MKKLPAIALIGCGLIAVTGTVAGAAGKSHVLDVPLPDGSVARVEYVGNVAPRVTIEPAASTDNDNDWVPLPSFAGFQGMVAQMDRAAEEMVRQAQQVARQPMPGAAAPYVASQSNVPAGTSSTTIVSFSSGGLSCTRTTEAISEGPGKPMKVTSRVSGNCRGVGARPSPAPSSTSHV